MGCISGEPGIVKEMMKSEKFNYVLFRIKSGEIDEENNDCR